MFLFVLLLAILRQVSGNSVTYNYTSVRGNFTGAPLIDGNVSWCPDDDDLMLNPVLKVDLGESVC